MHFDSCTAYSLFVLSYRSSLFALVRSHLSDSDQRLLEVLRRRSTSFSLGVKDREHVGDCFRDGRNLPGGFLVNELRGGLLDCCLINCVLNFDIMYDCHVSLL